MDPPRASEDVSARLNRSKKPARSNKSYGETRTRTGDTTIFSRVLYQLSYLAAGRLGARCYRLAGAAGCPEAAVQPARAAADGSAARRLFPGLQVGQRVDRVAAGRVPAADPHLEVQVRRGRVAGLAGEAELLPRGSRPARR